MLPLHSMMDESAPSLLSLATVRDNDTSLWLHNKLGSNEPWTSGSISSQLNAEVLRNVKECFIDLQTQVKLKFLLSFFHIPRRNIEEWRHELQEIIEVAQIDGEQWVSMMAEMMLKYSSTNCLQTEINTSDENARVYYELLQDLENELKRTEITSILPLECHYLNQDVFNQCIKSQKPQETHFTINRKPKSNALRAELYTRGIEAAEHSAKKIPAPTIPLRTRGMPRKMTDTTPLRGIPSNIPAGTRTPVTAQTQPRSVPRPPPEKKGGIKVLDINEQPVGFSAKRRKKTLDTDELKKSMQSSSESTGVENMETPDYAAGLGSDRPVTPPLTPLLPPPTPASYPPPPTPQPYAAMPPTPSTPLSSSSFGQSSIISDAPPPTPSSIPRYDGPPHIPNLSPSKMASVKSAQAANPMSAAQTLTKTVILQVANHQPQQIVTLSKELMEQAQEIFRNSNRATRPEKEHILKFMSGIKDNPCPELGNIVTIKLSEKHDSARELDGSYRPYSIETHFQMNYNTGEWKIFTKTNGSITSVDSRGQALEIQKPLNEHIDEYLSALRARRPQDHPPAAKQPRINIDTCFALLDTDPVSSEDDDDKHPPPAPEHKDPSLPKNIKTCFSLLGTDPVSSEEDEERHPPAPNPKRPSLQKNIKTCFALLGTDPVSSEEDEERRPPAPKPKRSSLPKKIKACVLVPGAEPISSDDDEERHPPAPKPKRSSLPKNVNTCVPVPGAEPISSDDDEERHPPAPKPKRRSLPKKVMTCVPLLGTEPISSDDDDGLDAEEIHDN